MIKQISGKTVLLVLAVIAIGMFVMPNTLAMYSGQPSLDSFMSGDDVDCEYCHGSSAAIYDELNSSSTGHSTFSCRDCHGFINYTPNTKDGSLKHAATTSASCIDCHAEKYTNDRNVQGTDNTIVVNGLTSATAAYKHRDNVIEKFNIATRIDELGLDGPCKNCHIKITIEMANNMVPQKNHTMINLSHWTYGNNGV
ncbi:MAG: hypothetical protein KAH86_00955 [Methanosarcinales archaeon]|nr:hypothetical protein [Methanosarcinales archaeon]